METFPDGTMDLNIEMLNLNTMAGNTGTPQGSHADAAQQQPADNSAAASRLRRASSDDRRKARTGARAYPALPPCRTA